MHYWPLPLSPSNLTPATLPHDQCSHPPIARSSELYVNSGPHRGRGLHRASPETPGATLGAIHTWEQGRVLDKGKGARESLVPIWEQAGAQVRGPTSRELGCVCQLHPAPWPAGQRGNMGAMLVLGWRRGTAGGTPEQVTRQTGSKAEGPSPPPTQRMLVVTTPMLTARVPASTARLHWVRVKELLYGFVE